MKMYIQPQTKEVMLCAASFMQAASAEHVTPGTIGTQNPGSLTPGFPIVII